jgi:hypothetical protein
MSTRSLVRWGGLVAVATAALLLGGAVVRYAGGAFAGQGMIFTALVIAMFGWTALYAVQAGRTGWLGLAGYVLMALSVPFTAPVAFGLMATFAGLQEAHALVMFAWGPVPILHLAVLCWTLGTVLFGTATMRAGVFSRWAGLMLAIGGALYIVAEYVPAMVALWPISSAATSVAIGWMGISLLSSPNAAIEGADRAMPLRQSRAA